MGRTFWTAAAIVAALLAIGVWASANSVFLYKHPKAPDARIVVDHVTGAAMVTARVESPKDLPAAPQVVADETEFDFGTMDPLSIGQHAFVIRNKGTAPLKLEVGPTTCKCTVSGLASKEVLPGEFTTVTLEWNTGRNLHYAHSGTIYTNDPLKKSLELRVQGEVRMLIGVDRDGIVLDRLEPDRPDVVDTLIYSQLWDGFTLDDVATRIPGLKWEIAAVDPASAAHLGAKSVQRLRITIPGDLPHGELSDSLRLTLKPSGDDAEPHHLDLPIRGTVDKPLAIYGPAIDDKGIIDLGTVLEGKGAKAKLLIKIRDKEAKLENAQVEVSPALLKATLTPHAAGGGQGLYDLVVELPPGAPPCSYRTSPLGRVNINTGHPRIGAIELRVSFAVLSR